MAIICVVALHWEQFLALISANGERALFTLRWKEQPLSMTYLACLFVGVVLFALVPYVEEILRGLRGKAISVSPTVAPSTGRVRSGE
jgi:predicted Co/Zn/Cd cation transporter (cation efflux family)